MSYVSTTKFVLTRCQLIGVTRGLEYLHDIGIVHGNLKSVSEESIYLSTLPLSSYNPLPSGISSSTRPVSPASTVFGIPAVAQSATAPRSGWNLEALDARRASPTCTRYPWLLLRCASFRVLFSTRVTPSCSSSRPGRCRFRSSVMLTFIFSFRRGSDHRNHTPLRLQDSLQMSGGLLKCAGTRNRRSDQLFVLSSDTSKTLPMEVSIHAHLLGIYA